MDKSNNDHFRWIFPPSTFGADEGQSGSETIFSDEDNLGRESAQNCIGANNSQNCTYHVFCSRLLSLS